MVKRLTLDCSSGHDLTVVRPALLPAPCRVWGLLKIFSLPFSLTLSHSPALSQEKKKKRKRKKSCNFNLSDVERLPLRQCMWRAEHRVRVRACFCHNDRREISRRMVHVRILMLNGPAGTVRSTPPPGLLSTRHRGETEV